MCWSLLHMGPKKQANVSSTRCGGGGGRGALNLETGEKRAPRPPLPGAVPGPRPLCLWASGSPSTTGIWTGRARVLMARETRTRGVGYTAEAALLFLISEPGTQPRVACLRSNVASLPTTATDAARDQCQRPKGSSRAQRASRQPHRPPLRAQFHGFGSPVFLTGWELTEKASQRSRFSSCNK